MLPHRGEEGRERPDTRVTILDRDRLRPRASAGAAERLEGVEQAGHALRRIRITETRGHVRGAPVHRAADERCEPRASRAGSVLPRIEAVEALARCPGEGMVAGIERRHQRRSRALADEREHSPGLDAPLVRGVREGGDGAREIGPCELTARHESEGRPRLGERSAVEPATHSKARDGQCPVPRRSQRSDEGAAADVLGDPFPAAAPEGLLAVEDVHGRAALREARERRTGEPHGPAVRLHHRRSLWRARDVSRDPRNGQDLQAPSGLGERRLELEPARAAAFAPEGDPVPGPEKHGAQECALERLGRERPGGDVVGRHGPAPGGGQDRSLAGPEEQSATGPAGGLQVTLRARGDGPRGEVDAPPHHDVDRCDAEDRPIPAAGTSRRGTAMRRAGRSPRSRSGDRFTPNRIPGAPARAEAGVEGETSVTQGWPPGGGAVSFRARSGM